MIKRFCDICNEEITDSNGFLTGDRRLKGTLFSKDNQINFEFEITTGKDGCWNNGDFCKYCIIDAVKSADDRDKKCEL